MEKKNEAKNFRKIDGYIVSKNGVTVDPLDHNNKAKFCFKFFQSMVSLNTENKIIC